MAVLAGLAVVGLTFLLIVIREWSEERESGERESAQTRALYFHPLPTPPSLSSPSFLISVWTAALHLVGIPVLPALWPDPAAAAARAAEEAEKRAAVAGEVARLRARARRPPAEAARGPPPPNGGAAAAPASPPARVRRRRG